MLFRFLSTPYKFNTIQKIFFRHTNSTVNYNKKLEILNNIESCKQINELQAFYLQNKIQIARQYFEEIFQKQKQTIPKRKLNQLQFFYLLMSENIKPQLSSIAVISLFLKFFIILQEKGQTINMKNSFLQRILNSQNVKTQMLSTELNKIASVYYQSSQLGIANDYLISIMQKKLGQLNQNLKNKANKQDINYQEISDILLKILKGLSLPHSIKIRHYYNSIIKQIVKTIQQFWEQLEKAEFVEIICYLQEPTIRDYTNFTNQNIEKKIKKDALENVKKLSFQVSCQLLDRQAPFYTNFQQNVYNQIIINQGNKKKDQKNTSTLVQFFRLFCKKGLSFNNSLYWQFEYLLLCCTKGEKLKQQFKQIYSFACMLLESQAIPANKRSNWLTQFFKQDRLPWLMKLFACIVQDYPKKLGQQKTYMYKKKWDFEKITKILKEQDKNSFYFIHSAVYIKGLKYYLRGLYYGEGIYPLEKFDQINSLNLDLAKLCASYLQNIHNQLEQERKECQKECDSKFEQLYKNSLKDCIKTVHSFQDWTWFHQYYKKLPLTKIFEILLIDQAYRNYYYQYLCLYFTENQQNSILLKISQQFRLYFLNSWAFSIQQRFLFNRNIIKLFLQRLLIDIEIVTKENSKNKHIIGLITSSRLRRFLSPKNHQINEYYVKIVQKILMKSQESWQAHLIMEYLTKHLCQFRKTGYFYNIFQHISKNCKWEKIQESIIQQCILLNIFEPKIVRNIHHNKEEKKVQQYPMGNKLEKLDSFDKIEYFLQLKQHLNAQEITFIKENIRNAQTLDIIIWLTKFNLNNSKESEQLVNHITKQLCKKAKTVQLGKFNIMALILNCKKLIKQGYYRYNIIGFIKMIIQRFHSTPQEEIFLQDRIFLLQIAQQFEVDFFSSLFKKQVINILQKIPPESQIFSRSRQILIKFKKSIY